MNYKFEISTFAAEDLINACRYYDCLYDGLGNELVQEWSAMCERILNHPQAFSYYRPPFRQVKINRFPYQIVYEVKNEIIHIVSFFNTHQDPNKKLPGLKL